MKLWEVLVRSEMVGLVSFGRGVVSVVGVVELEEREEALEIRLLEWLRMVWGKEGVPVESCTEGQSGWVAGY